MNANKAIKFSLLVLMGLCALFAPAQAQQAAALSLYGVKEILVRPVRIEDPAVAKSCRLVEDDLDAFILKELQGQGLPAVAEADSRPSTIDVARITLIPQIVPFNSQGLDCITWVALSAETRNHLRVLPIEIPRIVTIMYWRGGGLITSAISVHADHVNAALQKMVADFAQKYQTAQPPTVILKKPSTP